MPEMMCVEPAQEILAFRGDMPIIMCTGFSYVVDGQKAKAAGIKAFAMKPLTKRGDRQDHQEGAGRIRAGRPAVGRRQERVVASASDAYPSLH
jgi:CheY-like chemotaxis protein